MKTITVQIGNTDDKLTQIEWSKFIHKTNKLIGHRAKDVHFNGFSLPMEIWQNACWVFEIGNTQSTRLRDEIKQLCSEFNQDSIAWTEGVTEFING